MVLTCMFTRNNNFYLSTSYFCQTSMDQRTFALQDGHGAVPSISKLKNILRQLNISMLSTSKILLIRLNIVMKY